MKLLFSPYGLILIAFILFVLFWPRRTPDHIKKRVGRPMRAFPDEPTTAEDKARAKTEATGGKTQQGGDGSN